MIYPLSYGGGRSRRTPHQAGALFRPEATAVAPTGPTAPATAATLEPEGSTRLGGGCTSLPEVGR